MIKIVFNNLLTIKIFKTRGYDKVQVDKTKPNFYDVSLVDGYNLPVMVTTKQASPKCTINGCVKNLKSSCPQELQVLNKTGQVVACKSACLAFNLDSFCCRNEFGTPEKCKPSLIARTPRHSRRPVLLCFAIFLTCLHH